MALIDVYFHTTEFKKEYSTLLLCESLVDDIEKYKSVDFLGKQLEDEASLNLKVELIMMGTYHKTVCRLKILAFDFCN